MQTSAQTKSIDALLRPDLLCVFDGGYAYNLPSKPMISSTTNVLRFASVAVVVLSVGCASPPAQGDASMDGAVDGAPTSDINPSDATPEASSDGPVACMPVSAELHSLYPAPLYLKVGATGAIQLRLQRDPRACPQMYTITTTDPMVARPMNAMQQMPLNRGIMDIPIVAGMTPGRTRVRVVHSERTSDGVNPSIEADIIVMGDQRPACAMGTTAMGMLAPGARVAGAAGSPLAAASIGAPMTAGTAVPSQAVTIGCAADQVPDGFTAIGPAVSFGPSMRKFLREIPVTVPANPGLVPPRYELQVEISYTAPGLSTPRIVPVANVRFTQDGSGVTFDTPRMGTYQAVIRTGLGSRRVRRRYTYHAILGVSMGAIGTAILSSQYRDRFDFIAPLGGPADWNWFGQYFRDFHLGGFCTEAQRAMLGAACDRASNDRTPVEPDLWAVDQNFEFWNYPDGRGGQGGTFDRSSYLNILRDLTHQFGDAAIQSTDNSYLPRGVPVSELMRTDAQRCETPVTLMNFFDDEYNPDGNYPVITFCDGNRTPAHAGEWAGGQGPTPFEVSLAVDRNRNGVRDRGEPVIRNFTEPFSDFGTDGVPSTMEPGYNAMTNPDPAGDDYDRQFNPGGTEGNAVHEAAERYQDVGLDGIACPMGRMCPYDVGEGNGTFDTTQGVARFLARNPRQIFATVPREEAERMGVWADGGTRDLFNFGAVANHFVGAWAQQQQDLHYYNNFSALDTQHPIHPNDDEGFDHLNIDWERVPRHAMMRYGFEDAPADALQMGDGGHVGTISQVANRIYAGLWRAQANWPNLDRTIVPVQNTSDDAGRCANGYSCAFDFRSPRTGRTAPVGIALPPGYHRAENAGMRYPVMFMLHGYGMDASSLIPSGVLLRNSMSSSDAGSWQRPGKFILVFPDGRCRDGDGCLRGTFYTNSVFANQVQMEQFFLDLADYVDANFRVRMPEEIETVE